MTQQEFIQMTGELKLGNTNLFDRFFKSEYKRCVHIIRNQFNCSFYQAEPFVSEAFVIFWENILKDKVKFKSPVSYVVKIAQNRYKKEAKRRPNFNNMLDIDKAEYLLNEHYSDPIIEAEIKEEEKERCNDVKSVWKRLTENCRTLFQSVLYKDLKLGELGEEIGYRSYNTTKNTFARCKKKFREYFNERKSK